MFVPGKLGAIVGILLIWGGYALTAVICTTIADKVAEWLKNKEKQDD